MKLADIWPDLHDEIGGLFEIRLFGRIRIEPEIAQRRGENIIGGIQHVNAAIPELRQILRFEDNGPTVDPGVGTENLLHRLDVVADAGRAPHVVGGVLIAGGRRWRAASSLPARRWQGSAASTCRVSGKYSP